MKKSLLFITMALFVSFTAKAASIGKQKAQQKAVAFITEKMTASTIAKRAAGDRLLSDGGSPASGNFYVFNVANGQGFVIVSDDDRMPEVLAYSDKGSLDLNNLPDNLRQWLQSYDEQFSSLNGNTQQVARRSPLAAIEPLLTTQWGQGTPYNLLCPTKNGEFPLTGCVATAMAQVMYYYKWPQGATKATAAYSGTNGSYAGLPSTTFEWDNMLTSYSGSSTDAQKLAVAKLMQYCGSAVMMNYGYGGAESLSANGLIAPFMQQYFGYAAGGKCVRRSDYTDVTWEELIYHELKMGRPVIYGGNSENGNGGHTFVCDGCDADGRFHMNWGWNGGGNGYYYLTALYPEGYTNRYVSDDAVIGLQYDGWEDRFVIKANNITRNYGDENPALTYTKGDGITGNGEPQLECDAKPDSPVGTYPIRISKGSVTDDRAIYVEGTLTVKPALLTITARDVTMKQGDPMPEFEADYVGWKLDDDENTFTRRPTFNTSANSKSLVGTYNITPKDAEAPNYEMKYVKGILTMESGKPYDVKLDNIFYNLFDETMTAEVTYGPKAQGNYSGSVSIPAQIEVEGKNYRVTSIGTSAFNTCSGLTSVSIPESVTSIFGFGGCFNLEEIVLPSKLEEIGPYAFSYCSSLKAIDIPASVATIGSGAFSACDKMVKVTVRSVVPINLTSNPFSSVGNKTLYVPSGSKEAYESAMFWKSFKEIIEMSVLKGDVNGDGDVDIADAVCIVNHIVGKPNTTFIEAAADADGDGTIDIADAVHIVNYVVGKINALAPRLDMTLPEPQ